MNIYSDTTNRVNTKKTILNSVDLVLITANKKDRLRPISDSRFSNWACAQYISLVEIKVSNYM